MPSITADRTRKGTASAPTPVTPADVHNVLARHLLTDGFKLVLDTRASQGSTIVDARDGQRYLDMYTFFASAPLGCNHPGIVDDPDFMALLADVSANKPANSDIYSTHLAEFVETFSRVLGDPRPSAHVLRRGRRHGGRERLEGRLRLEEPAQRGLTAAPPTWAPEFST